MSQPRIALLSKSRDTARRWRDHLSDLDACFVDSIDNTSVDGQVDLIITDDAGRMDALTDPTRHELDCGVISIGADDIECDAALPIDATPREIQTVCRLVLELIRLRRVCALHLQSEQHLKDIAEHDPLTELANRRAWDDELERRCRVATAGGDPFCLALIDLDHFKQVNTDHGYSVADDVLRHAAIAMQNSVRSHDFVARIGGDEFAILLANVTQDRAHAITDRIRRSIEVAIEAAMQLKLTATAGIATWTGDPSVAELFDAADANLRHGKRLGRNQTVASIAQTF